MKNSPTSRSRGFALVLSLVVMAMLLLLCLSCAALFAVELRSSRQAVATARAKANALAAARIALGELQRLVGPDRRITANAAILEPGPQDTSVLRPYLTGVWKGLTHESGAPAGWSTANRPAVAPVAGYKNDHDQAFAGWLTSGHLDTGTPLNAANRAGLDWLKGLKAAKEAGDWRLYRGGAASTGSLASKYPVERQSLYARPEAFSGEVADVAGPRFAWVVTDENQKARVDLRDGDQRSASPLGDAERAALAAASARRFHPAHPEDGTGEWPSSVAPTSGRSVFEDLSSLFVSASERAWLPAEPPASGASGADEEPARALRHDFTTQSVSLLTDVANGGLKRDVNLLALMSDADFDKDPVLGDVAGSGRLIGFEAATNAESTGRSAWWRSAKTQSLIHPVVDKGNFTDQKIWPLWNDVRSWSAFATTAMADDGKPVLEGGALSPAMRQIAYAGDVKFLNQSVADQPDRMFYGQWRQPVLSRFRWEFSLHALPDASGVTYRVYPMVNMIFQIWNPYNVDLVLNSKESFGVIVEGPPFGLTITGKAADGVTSISRNIKLVGWYNGTGQDPLSAYFNYSGVIKAGETQTYSVPMSAGASGTSVVLQPGYYPGHYMRFTPSMNKYDANGFNKDFPLSAQIFLRSDRDNYRSPLVLHMSRNGAWGPCFGSSIFTGVEAGYNFSNNNPARLIESGRIDGIPSPAVLQSNTVPKPLMIYETRLKAEAFSGSSLKYTSIESGKWRVAAPLTDGERAIFGEPITMGTSFAVPDGLRSTWAGAAYESLVWAVDEVNDTETTWPLQVKDGMSGYSGTGLSAATGSLSYVYHHLPLHPPVGLFSLRHARLGGGVRPLENPNKNLGMVSVHNAFGNALLNPYVPIGEAYVPSPIVQTSPVGLYLVSAPAKPWRAFDMSWVMNAAVADTWFSSSLGAWDQGLAAQRFPALAKPAATLFTRFLAGQDPLPDRRLASDRLSPNRNVVTLSQNAAPADAYKKLASALLVEGGFNINSTSLRAWRAFLASGHADTRTAAFKTGTALLSSGQPRVKPDGTVTVPVAAVPNSPPTANPAGDKQNQSYLRANGGRILSDADLDKLAAAMVAEVKKRGPFLSVGEFLNRRLEPGEFGRRGAVQAAIEAAGLNQHLATTGRKLDLKPLARDTNNRGFDNVDDINDVYAYSGVNRPGWLAQADLLAPLASALTVRGDTFVVRVAASAAVGGGPAAALELHVRRTYAYVAPGGASTRGDAPDAEFLDLTHPANKAFGRRLEVVSARWIPVDSL